VICFQIVLWQDCIQLEITGPTPFESCDLLSDCSLTRLHTVYFIFDTQVHVLWFAFRLFFDKIAYSDNNQDNYYNYVVICFQIVLWQDCIQSSYRSKLRPHCCDLLSDCSLTRLHTVVNISLLILKCCDLLSDCSLTRLHTVDLGGWDWQPCCDLLSDCSLTRLHTVNSTETTQKP